MDRRPSVSALIATAMRRVDDVPSPMLVPRVELNGSRCESLIAVPTTHEEHRSTMVALESPVARVQTIAVLRKGPRVLAAFVVMTDDAYRRRVAMPYYPPQACEEACWEVLVADSRDRGRLLGGRRS